MYFTRGYAFHTFDHGNQRSTANYGVCVIGDSDFYGILQDIIEVEYPGMVNLKCTLFKCDWFDPVLGRGVRTNKFGVVDVNKSRRYKKFEPFVLASQAEQVTFISYPRIRQTGISWLSVIKVSPRGQICGNDEVPMQQDFVVDISTPDQAVDDILLIDPQNRVLEDLGDDDEDQYDDDDHDDDDDTNDDDVDSDISEDE